MDRDASLLVAGLQERLNVLDGNSGIRTCGSHEMITGGVGWKRTLAITASLTIAGFVQAREKPVGSLK